MDSTKSSLRGILAGAYAIHDLRQAFYHTKTNCFAAIAIKFQIKKTTFHVIGFLQLSF